MRTSPIFIRGSASVPRLLYCRCRVGLTRRPDGAASRESRSDGHEGLLRRNAADIFGAELPADPPGQPAFARLAGRKHDPERFGDLEIFGDPTNAAFGNVDDRAVAR